MPTPNQDLKLGRAVTPYSLSRLGTLILSALGREPLHGYAIGQQVMKLSRDQIRPGPGSLYEQLNRLKDQGLIKAEKAEEHNGRLRKRFRLTDNGREALDQELKLFARARTASRPPKTARQGQKATA